MCRILTLACLPLLLLASRADTTLTSCTAEALRAAVAEGGIIQLECSENLITLTNPIVVSKDAVILTTNAAMVISGGNQTRLFVVDPGVGLTISNVALFSGRHTDTNFNDGGIPATAGAAIYNDGGTVRIYGSTIASHTVIGTTGRPGESGLEGQDGEAGGDGAGAAIFNRQGSVIVSNSIFSANTATGGLGGNGGNGGSGGLGGPGGDGGNGGSGAGAAIYSLGGIVSVQSCTFTNNQAMGAAAGIGGTGAGVFGFNGGPGGAGEAVGGAIAGDSAASIVIENSTFVNNRAEGADGNEGADALRNLEGGEGANGGSASGGALFGTGNIIIRNCTFTSNSAGGGNGGSGGSGSSAGFGTDGGDGGDGGNANGGAMETTGSALVINATFADNSVTAGTPGAGGPGAGVLGEEGETGSAGAERGGSISNFEGNLALANTILANSTPANASGAITDRGGNLSTDASAAFTNPRSAVLIDPLLRPLSRNGGPTPTMAISSNSPAVNAGIIEFCLPTDQRGSNRWFQCDIGAFEFNGGVPIAPTNIALNIAPNLPGMAHLTNALAITWTTNASNLALFVNTNLASANWLLVTNAAQVVSNLNAVAIPFTNAPQRFFRLGATNLLQPPSPALSAEDADPADPGSPAPPGF